MYYEEEGEKRRGKEGEGMLRGCCHLGRRKWERVYCKLHSDPSLIMRSLPIFLSSSIPIFHTPLRYIWCIQELDVLRGSEATVRAELGEASDNIATHVLAAKAGKEAFEEKTKELAEARREAMKTKAEWKESQSEVMRFLHSNT